MDWCNSIPVAWFAQNNRMNEDTKFGEAVFDAKTRVHG
jgi:hypothetical protein